MLNTYSFIKFFFDVFFSFFGLIILSPLFLLIIIILRFSGDGEIFYLQERMGYKNKPFFIYKFASMMKNSADIGNKTVTVRNDPRITKFGKFLRITKLNELPQIINVLKGEMSFVGPRPLLILSFKKYNLDVQKLIYLNKPGITGIGSLIFRDEELLVSKYKDAGKDPLEYYKLYIYPYKGALELWYFKNRSFMIDIKILFLTFWSIFFKDSLLVFKSIKGLPNKPSILSVTGINNLTNKI